MPTQHTYNKRFSVDLDTSEAAQVVPIMGSEYYRRFTIQIANAGAGVATLMGSLDGSTTKGTVATILDDGVLNHAATSKAGFSVIKDNTGDDVFTGLGNGLYIVEITTRMTGGVLLDFTGINNDDGDRATVTVLMSGNAQLTGSPRGA